MRGVACGEAGSSSRSAWLLLVATALLGSAFTPVGAADGVASAGGTPWQIQDSPNEGSATARLVATACSSDSDCWAVGHSLPGTTTFATMAHWTGGDWAAVEAPVLDRHLTYLFGAACAAADECFAVGMVSNTAAFFAGEVPWPYVHAAIFRWDGSAWDLATPTFTADPAKEFAVLRAVSCSGPGDCWAVGGLNEGSRNLVLHWDGGEWTRTAVPALGSDNLELGALSCPAVDFCLAVGPTAADLVVPAPRSPTAAIWDGTTWTSAPSPVLHVADAGSPIPAMTTWLNGVACAAPDDCWAVGDADSALLLDGDGDSAGPSVPLVQHWDGAGWAASVVPAAPVPIPAPTGGLSHHVDDVACSSPTDCWAVGHADSDAVMAGAASADYLLHYDGTAWLPGPALADPLATTHGDLASVACPSATRCWAVGQISPAGQVHGLLQGYDGTLWTATAIPAADAVVGNYVQDVTCAADDDCWAVGFHFYGQLGRTLIEHWDGSSWSVVGSPNSGDDRYNALTGISCAASDDCWAVGSSSTWNRQDLQPLALHWDGAAWTLSDPLPDSGPLISAASSLGVVYAGQDAQLQGVHCVASDDCWAVGSIAAAAGQSGSFLVGAAVNAKPLFLHWDGVTWSPVPGPATLLEPLTESVLVDVTCVAPSECVAVGSKFARLQYNFLEGRDAQTLVSQWDGHAWTEAASANLSPHINQLSSVACAGLACWAVGSAYLDYAYSGSPRIAPLILQRMADGTWQDAAQLPGTGFLSGVSCSAADDCWTVGSRFTSWSDPQATLAAHWDGMGWTAASSPNAANVPGKPSDNLLTSVTCEAGPDCWAAGHASLGTSKRTLLLRAEEIGCRAAGPGPCARGGPDPLVAACAPNASSAPKGTDKDGDGLPAQYVRRHNGYEVGSDGSVQERPASGDCWLFGDPDDDGTTRTPGAGLPPGVVPAASACAPSASSAPKGLDKDGDGIPAQYVRRHTVYELNDDGSISTRNASGDCWLFGDPDDDGVARVPPGTATPPGLPAFA